MCAGHKVSHHIGHTTVLTELMTKTTEKPTELKKQPVTLSCPHGEVLLMQKISGFDSERKPAPAALAKCADVQEIFTTLQKQCDWQQICHVKPEDTRFDKKDCPGLEGIHIYKECIPTSTTKGIMSYFSVLCHTAGPWLLNSIPAGPRPFSVSLHTCNSPSTRQSYTFYLVPSCPIFCLL